MAKRFSETKIGQFLKGVAPAAVEALGVVFPPVNALVDIFGEKIPPEKMIEFERLKREYEMNELKEYLNDVQDARRANVEIQTSSEASWLAKNLAYIIDLAIVLSTIVLAMLLYYKRIPVENKEIAYSLLGLLFAQLVTVINFHRGTSKSSSDKQLQINELLKKKIE